MKKMISGFLMAWAFAFALGAHAANYRIFSCADFVVGGVEGSSSWSLQACRHYSMPSGLMLPTHAYDAIDLGECVDSLKTSSTQLAAVRANGALDLSGDSFSLRIDLSRAQIDAYGVISPYRGTTYYPAVGNTGAMNCVDVTNVF